MWRWLRPTHRTPHWVRWTHRTPHWDAWGAAGKRRSGTLDRSRGLVHRVGVAAVLVQLAGFLPGLRQLDRAQRRPLDEHQRLPLGVADGLDPDVADARGVRL